MKRIFIIYLLIVISGITTCQTTGVKWTNRHMLDFSKGANVKITSQVKFPEKEMNFLREDVPKHIDKIFTGDKKAADSYVIEIVITRYQEASCLKGCIFAPLGYPWLIADIKVTKGEDPVILMQGKIDKSIGTSLISEEEIHRIMIAPIGIHVAQSLNENYKPLEKTEGN